MADDMGEKTEDATPRKKAKAREDGNIPKSSDLGAVIMLFVATITVVVAGLWLLMRGQILVERVLAGDQLGRSVDADHLLTDIGWLAAQAAYLLAPILIVIWIAGLISQFMQVGLLFTLKPIQPSLNKLNPLKGAQKIFGWTGLMKAGIDVLKVTVVLTAAILTVAQYVDQIRVLPLLLAFEGVRTIAGMVLDLALRLLLLLLIIGLLDFWYQRWKHSRDLKMTKQEVKDEMKSSQGDPQVKNRRMRMQQEIAMQRISAAVPQADVIVTNPEHISIAIKYDEATMGAPKVVAKGADFLAMRIRQIATMHGIPIVERKPLARALYRDVEVGQEIPPDFYSAVAEVLAYVYRLAS